MAEGDGVTQAEAEAFTEKAAGLMARYGIDRALLAAARPGHRPPRQPEDRRAQSVGGRPRASAGRAGHRDAVPVRAAFHRQRQANHVFGYESDLERAEMLYTSLLIQMAHGLAAAPVPATARSVRAWRRSWLWGTPRRWSRASRRLSSGPPARPGRRPTVTGQVRRWSWRTGRWRCAAVRGGLPGHPQAADDLYRQRLRFWLRRGPARRHRGRAPARPARPPPRARGRPAAGGGFHDRRRFSADRETRQSRHGVGAGGGGLPPPQAASRRRWSSSGPASPIR